jgi:hypothetical protein
VSAHARARNGRAAWFALRSHYLGPTNQLKIMTRAEGDLESKFYNGEHRNLLLNVLLRFISKLIQIWKTLESH